MRPREVEKIIQADGWIYKNSYILQSREKLRFLNIRVIR